MDIVFSDSFLACFPDADAHMRDVILQNNAQDLLRVGRGRDILPNQKTLVWSIQVDGMRFRPLDANVERAGVIWVDAKELDELDLDVIVGEFGMNRRERRFLLILGVEDVEQKNTIRSRLVGLEMRHRVHILFFETLEAALAEVYRWSVGMNPYCLVQPDTPLASDKHRAKYISMLLRRIDGMTVPQVKYIVDTFPTWGALCDAMGPESGDEDVKGPILELPEWIISRLRWLCEEFGSLLRKMDHDP
ncbi:hypothetical protein V5O48_018434 [Marasmius crinis-equi]|uniref:Uncharacterized protein n=1 Tax=Marasmius crinis-equi TaxID=585013 RepID=A0ABR3EL74_9AGAR